MASGRNRNWPAPRHETHSICLRIALNISTPPLSQCAPPHAARPVALPSPRLASFAKPGFYTASAVSSYRPATFSLRRVSTARSRQPPALRSKGRTKHHGSGPSPVAPQAPRSSITTRSAGKQAGSSRQARRPARAPAAGIHAASMARGCQNHQQEREALSPAIVEWLPAMPGRGESADSFPRG